MSVIKIVVIEKYIARVRYESGKTKIYSRKEELPETVLNFILQEDVRAFEVDTRIIYRKIQEG